MPIELTCPSCGKQLRLADEHAGKAGRCPACQATFQIPTAGEQAAASPFGGAPTQPFGSPPAPAGNLFGEQKPPNPFASTSNMQSPYGGTNPYGSGPPNLYGAPPASSGEGMATASMILGIVTIVSGLFSFCCCGLWLITFPCGITGIVLAFQAPQERRNLGLTLNIVGLALTVLLFVGKLVFGLALNANQGNFNFNP
jgi:hypothetical protein